MRGPAGDASRMLAPTRPPLHADAAAALELLGDGPLRPTGAVARALAEGRLLRTGDDAALDRLERTLREGVVDRTEQAYVGNGVNGDFFRRRVADPADPTSPATWAVEKTAGQQAAQEELGWRLARAMGIDHLVAAVARRADGTAHIQYREGRAASLEGITDVARLEQALTKSYLDDAALALSPEEAAQAARIDRQLLQLFDYVLANNDRSAANARADARTGVAYIDAGHAGRGTLSQNGGTLLEPALQLFQAGPRGGRVSLDAVVVDHVRRRVTPDDLRAIHAAVFDAPGIAGPAPRTLGEQFIGLVRSDGYREGMVARLEHALEGAGYAHRGYRGDAGGELPPLIEERMRDVHGFAAVRAAMHGAYGGGRF